MSMGDVVDINPKTGKPKRPMTDRQRAALEKAHAALRAKNDKPASGMPASGMPASGMPAMGPGWGGPASGRPAVPANPGQRGPRPIEFRLAEADRALDKVGAIMDDPEAPLGLQLAAAIHLRNQVLGTPVQRVAVADASKITLGDLLASLPDE